MNRQEMLPDRLNWHFLHESYLDLPIIYLHHNKFHSHRIRQLGYAIEIYIQLDEHGGICGATHVEHYRILIFNTLKEISAIDNATTVLKISKMVEKINFFLISKAIGTLSFYGLINAGLRP